MVTPCRTKLEWTTFNDPGTLVFGDEVPEVTAPQAGSDIALHSVIPTFWSIIVARDTRGLITHVLAKFRRSAGENHYYNANYVTSTAHLRTMVRHISQSDRIVNTRRHL